MLYLHVCCGVCALGSIYRLLDFDYKIQLVFYNPNIYPFEEFLLRLNESIKVANYFNLPLILIVGNKHFKINKTIIEENEIYFKIKNERLQKSNQKIEHIKLLKKLKINPIQIKNNNSFRNISIRNVYELWLDDHKKFLKLIKGLEKLPEGSERCSKCFKMRLDKLHQISKNKELFTTTLTISPYKNSDMIFKIAEPYENFLKINFKKKNGFLFSKKLAKMLGLYDQTYCGCEFSIY